MDHPLTIILSTTRFLSAIARLSLGPLLPTIMKDLNLSSSSSGDLTSQLLSSYSLGYLATQLIGGYTCDKYGSRIVLTFCTLLGCMALILPMIIDYFQFIQSNTEEEENNTVIKIWIRSYFLLGLSAGPLFPASSSAIRNSSSILPPSRAKVAAVIDASASAGTCVASLTPWLAGLVWGGWKSVLLVVALLLGFVGFFLGFLFGSDFEEEKGVEEEENLVKRKDDGSLNTMSVLFSASSMALYICHSCSNFSTYIINAWIPTMLVSKYPIDPSLAGFYLAIYELVGVFSRLAFSKYYTGSSTRSTPCDSMMQKMMMVLSPSFVAFAFQSIFLYGVFQGGSASSSTMSLAFTIVMLISSSLVTGLHAVGFRLEYVQVPPNFAGLVSGLGNTVASMASATGPFVVGAIIFSTVKDDNDDIEEDKGRWLEVGKLMFVVNVVGTLASLCLGGVPELRIGKKEGGVCRQQEEKEQRQRSRLFRWLNKWCCACTRKWEKDNGIKSL